jgi:hypothetical protein
MPQNAGRTKTLLTLSGVFLFLGALLVTIPSPFTMTFALFIPGLYCIWAASAGGLRTGILGGLPALLGVFPAFTQGALLYLSLFMCGVSMYALVRRRKIGLAVALPAGLLLFFFGAGIVLYAFHGGMDLPQVLQLWVKQVMDQVAEVYASVLSPADLANFRTQRPFIEQTIVRLLPAMTATTFIFMFWINLLLMAKVDGELDLKAWRTPDWVVALFILAGVCTLLAHPVLQTLGYNVLIVVSIGYFFQGLSIVAYYFNIYHWTPLLRLVIYLLILSQFYIMIMVALCGLFDTWFYFRKRIQREGEDI